MRDSGRRFIISAAGSLAGLISDFFASSALDTTNKLNWLSLIILIVTGTICGNMVNYLYSRKF